MAGPSPRKKIRLLVLYGGRSAEHDISCISALHVVGAVDPDRYDLRLVGITTGGDWVEATPAIGSSSGGSADLRQAMPSPDSMSRPEKGVSALERVNEVAADGSDEAPLVVLPLLHGPMGEDGTIQGLLELAGVPYCGPSVAGSAAAMDKGMAKDLLAAAGIPQARHIFLREGDVDSSLVARVERELGWPVFVKPANMGSSIGISRVKDPGGLHSALDVASRYDEYLLIEEAVSGRELEIGVLGWPDLKASVPGEIKPSHDFYDFEDKYLDGAAVLEIPARLSEGVADEMARLAVGACRALRIDSMARVDFFYEEEGRGLLVNEINTIPGFTPISMYPRMWAASGVSYPELVDVLVDQALRRASRRARFETHR
jgi:D-alanine-D-alanine ligase